MSLNIYDSVIEIAQIGKKCHMLPLSIHAVFPFSFLWQT